jgi:D-glycero-beta-D-manno-heptose-7-phosphate kinase
VMILRYERTETMPGGAGNAAANVAALAGSALVMGVTGRDVAGRQLTLGLRRRAVSTLDVITLKGYTTPTKTRILAGSVHSTRQQVIRIDREPESGGSEDLTERLISRLLPRLSEVDAVIISDYNYGVVSDRLLEALRGTLSGGSIPVVVDSRYRLGSCRGFTAATPNQAELEELVKRRLTTDAELSEAGAGLRADLQLEALLLTRGGEGMILFEEDRSPSVLAAVGSKEPVDVTGAGDTVIAAFTLALAAGASYPDAAAIANHAGGLVVMKRGTATISREELLKSLTEG